MYQDHTIKQYDAPIVPVNAEWIEGYKWLDAYRSGNDNADKCYWYDEQVLDYFDRYGLDRFTKLNIWQVDWNRKAQLLGRRGNYSDPRSRFEKWVHRFIEENRENIKMNQGRTWRAVRLFGETVLRSMGW